MKQRTGQRTLCNLIPQLPKDEYPLLYGFSLSSSVIVPNCGQTHTRRHFYQYLPIWYDDNVDWGCVWRRDFFLWRWGQEWNYEDGLWMGKFIETGWRREKIHDMGRLWRQFILPCMVPRCGSSDQSAKYPLMGRKCRTCTRSLVFRNMKSYDKTATSSV